MKAALLVAVVSVSLSIGLGIASGTTPIAGLRMAIWRVHVSTFISV